MRHAALLACAISVLAQDSNFDVQSRLVLIPVTVADKKGNRIDGLAPSSFVVLDEGKPQPIIVDSFATGVAAIALVIAVQTSGISAPALGKVRKIGAMIQPLITGERGCAALLSFAERIEWKQDFTTSPNALARAFDELRPAEAKSARMLDAVHQATERLRRRPQARRVLLLISESRDRGSDWGLEASVMAAQAAGVTVYAATYSPFKTAFTIKPSEVERPGKPKGPPEPGMAPQSPREQEISIPPPEQRGDLLGGIGELLRLGKINTTEVMTDRTGGMIFKFARLKGLEEAIEKLGAELHGQYVLSFKPKAPAPGYHRLEVRVGSGEYRVRSRLGYWSAGRAR